VFAFFVGKELPMATAVSQSEKVLVYDGDCPMCRGTVALLLRAGWVRSEQLRSNHEIAEQDADVVRAAGIRNQLVVLDLGSRQSRSGVEGLLWIARDNARHRLLVRILGLPLVRQLLRIGYETISYNRRILSPPRRQIVCDCEPEVTLPRRLMLVVPALLVTIALQGAFGAALVQAALFPTTPSSDARTGAILAILAGGSGALGMAVVALLSLGEKRLDYIAHLVVTMFIGSLCLLPATVGFFVLPPRFAIALGGLSLVAGFWRMLSMQRRRTAALGLRRRWLVGWALAWLAGFVLSLLPAISHVA
jgi:predicted DCC family thiol-disulfide oxidoreductase YuxK